MMKTMKREILAWVDAGTWRWALAVVLLVSVVWLAVYPGRSSPKLGANPPIKSLSNSDFGLTKPIPPATGLDVRIVALGARLFHETKLSADDSVSCATCHSLSSGGVDGLQRSVGINGAVGNINAPTVFNSGLNSAQFWDGRAPTLEDQVNGPVTHPGEMGSTWPQVISKLEKEPSYRDAFSELFKDGITANNIKTALATFERSLLTPDSRFDLFLKGDTNALSAQEKKGYELFESYGCSSCHQGVNLGGNMFEKMGLMGDYFADRGQETEADKGRFKITGQENNLHEFRVPTLRNVALTAPYFHDGSAKTLEDAIRIMVKYQLGRPMPTEDVSDIAAFLRALTGQYLGKPL